MSISLKEKNFATLILVVIVGIIIGAYLSELIGAMIPGVNNVVKNLFTTSIEFGPGYPHPLTIDLAAIKFQIGFQFKFGLLSIVGIFLSLYFFRWYK